MQSNGWGSLYGQARVSRDLGRSQFRKGRQKWHNTRKTFFRAITVEGNWLQMPKKGKDATLTDFPRIISTQARRHPIVNSSRTATQEKLREVEAFGLLIRAAWSSGFRIWQPVPLSPSFSSTSIFTKAPSCHPNEKPLYLKGPNLGESVRARREDGRSSGPLVPKEWTVA